MNCEHRLVNVGLPTPVVIKFSSVNRNDTEAVMIHEPSQSWEEEKIRYAALNHLNRTVAGWVNAIYRLTTGQYEKVCINAQLAVIFCEGRYGHSVDDYEEHKADCVLTIV